MCQLILKLSRVLKLLILTAKLLVDIKTQDFYSCLILTENLVLKFFIHSRVLKLLILMTEIPVNIKRLNLNKLVIFNNMTYKGSYLHNGTQIQFPS